MGPRQVRISEEIQLTPRQAAALEATRTHRYILYGGARGGGKSKWLRWWLLDYLMYQYSQGRQRVRVMLACETYPDLRDRQITKIKTEFPLWLGELKDTKEDGLCFFLRPEFGSGIIALRNLDDPTKYQSAEFAAIGVDELTKITKETFDILRGSLRWPGISHTVFAGATNPGGIGHGWVKQLWIDRDFPTELQNRAHEFVFIQSLPADNPHLDPSYWDELNSLPTDLRRAWVDGDWNVFAGQAFPAWREAAHVIDPFTIPAYWPRWRGLDWGYASPFACLWLTKDPDRGRIYVYREAYGPGMTDQQQARLIRELTPPGENISITYADPSMFGRRHVGEQVYSTADTYASEGVPLTPADNDRLSGKRKVDRLLMSLPDGLPGLQVFRTCTNLIRSLPALAYDRSRVEDVDTTQDDHCYDALKYALTNTTTKPVHQRPPEQQRSPLQGIRIL